MKPGAALDLVLKTYKIKAVDIAKKADMRPQEINRFTRGRRETVSSDTLVHILKAMPDYARQHFIYLCCQDDVNQQN